MERSGFLKSKDKYRSILLTLDEHNLPAFRRGGASYGHNTPHVKGAESATLSGGKLARNGAAETH